MLGRTCRESFQRGWRGPAAAAVGCDSPSSPSNCRGCWGEIRNESWFSEMRAGLSEITNSPRCSGKNWGLKLSWDTGAAPEEENPPPALLRARQDHQRERRAGERTDLGWRDRNGFKLTGRRFDGISGRNYLFRGS